MFRQFLPSFPSHPRRAVASRRRSCIRSAWYASMILVVTVSTFASGSTPTLVGIDPLVVYQTAGRWGAFGLPDAVNAYDGGIEIYVEPSHETNFPGTVTGGITLDIGDVEFSYEDYQLEIPIRVLGDNEASRVIVTLSELGAPQTGEHYQYQLDLTELVEDEWTNIVRPLTDFSGVATQGGDGLPLEGFSTLQLHAPFNSVEVINVEVGGVFVRPIPAMAEPDVPYRFDGNVFTGGYQFGTYLADGAVDNQRDLIVIDAEPGGGLGIRTTESVFDPTTHDIVVRAQLGGDNEASVFHLNLKDNDGMESIDTVAAEEWLYEIETSHFSTGGVTEFRVPATFFSWRWPGNGDAQDGNTTPDFGLYQLQVHSLANRPGRLNLEIESIAIVDRGEMLVPGDYNGDNELGVIDLERLVRAAVDGPAPAWFDANQDGTVNLDDASYWVTDLKNTYFGDANLDGEFNSSDLVQVFSVGKHETDNDATWSDGDWNFDGQVSSADFVVAFIDGGYELGPKGASAVPEPTKGGFTIGLLVVLSRRMRRCI